MKRLPARFWKRGVAYIIDMFIISFIVLGPFSSLYKADVEINSIADFVGSLQASFALEFWILGLVIALLTLFYWAFMEWKFGQSVGKIFLGLYVKPKKGELKFGQALVRNVTKLSTLIILLDCLYILKNKKKNQRFFEKLSDTFVIEEVKVI